MPGFIFFNLPNGKTILQVSTHPLLSYKVEFGRLRKAPRNHIQNKKYKVYCFLKISVHKTNKIFCQNACKSIATIYFCP